MWAKDYKRHMLPTYSCLVAAGYGNERTKSIVRTYILLERLGDEQHCNDFPRARVHVLIDKKKKNISLLIRFSSSSSPLARPPTPLTAILYIYLLLLLSGSLSD